MSLVTGLQAALGQLGGCPLYLGTANTSAASHELEPMPGRKWKERFHEDMFDAVALGMMATG